MDSGADVVASTDVVASAEVSEELRTGTVEVDVVEIGVEVVDVVGAVSLVGVVEGFDSSSGCAAWYSAKFSRARTKAATAALISASSPCDSAAMYRCSASRTAAWASLSDAGFASPTSCAVVVTALAGVVGSVDAAASVVGSGTTVTVMMLGGVVSVVAPVAVVEDTAGVVDGTTVTVGVGSGDGGGVVVVEGEVDVDRLGRLAYSRRLLAWMSTCTSSGCRVFATLPRLLPSFISAPSHECAKPIAWPSSCVIVMTRLSM